MKKLVIGFWLGWTARTMVTQWMYRTFVVPDATERAMLRVNADHRMKHWVDQRFGKSVDDEVTDFADGETWRSR